MSELVHAGYFRELPHVEGDGAPALAELRSNEPLDHEADIVAYLDGCPVVLWEPEPEYDVLEKSIELGVVGVRSDGVWTWPSSLGHYVARYHLRLPADFLMHMAMNEWTPPDEASVDVPAERLVGRGADS